MFGCLALLNKSYSEHPQDAQFSVQALKVVYKFGVVEVPVP